jgi:RNA recognition motif-containing protein
MPRRIERIDPIIDKSVKGFISSLKKALGQMSQCFVESNQKNCGRNSLQMNSWWVSDKTGHKRGPFSPHQVSRLISLNSISPSSLVYSENNEDWIPLSSCEILKDCIAGELLDETTTSSDSPRLPMSTVPVIETMPCSDPSCANSSCGSCDMVFIWDRSDKMWFTYDEYVELCRSSGLTEGLPDRVLASPAQIQELLNEADVLSKRTTTQKPKHEVSDVVSADDEPLSDPEKEAKRQKRRAYRERKKLKRDAGLWVGSKVNPNIYVSGLPPDITTDELYDIFHQAGQLKPDLEAGTPNTFRIKLYGNGDGLVTFLHEESVGLAVQRFNGYTIRDGYTISVQQADFKTGSDPIDTPALTLDELRARAEMNKDHRQKVIGLYKKEKDLRSAWDVSEYGVNDKRKRPVVVFGPIGVDVDYDYIESCINGFCEKFGEIKKIIKIHNFFCAKFKTIQQADACVAALSEGLEINSPEPVIIPGFLHDGRDLTLLTTRAESSLFEPPTAQWDEFLDGVESDDEDLVIRTEG